MSVRSILLPSFVICFLLVFNGGFSSPSKYEGMIIKKIEFYGLKNVDADDLYSELEETFVDVGLPLKASEVRNAIKLVFKKGEFENVLVEVEEYKDGVKLRFICKERPIISAIEFRGVEELSEVDLSNMVLVKEGEVLRLNKLEDSIKVIKSKYKEDGFFNVVIEYRLKKDEDENTVEVRFVIDEGEEIIIEKISILGARKIAADDLTDVMETDEDGWFTDGTFRKDIYEEDKGKIIGYYKENGYIDAQIIEDKVEYEWDDPEEKEDRVIYITLKVSEGEKYYFDKYTIAGNKVFETKQLESGFEQTESGEIFNDTLFQRDRQSISFIYASKGYIFARVIPKRTVDEREVEVDDEKEIRKYVRIDFQIEEGRQAYIENIIIKGNQKTKDKVIKRELIIKEGELFNSARVQQSRERVFNLGFFKEVNFDIRPGSREGFMNLIVDVEEQPTGTISLGGGYGTNSGFSIFSDISENNFLGNGQRIGVRFQYGPEQRSITLSFKEPWLFDYPVGFSTSVFYELNTVKTSSMFSYTNYNDDYAEYQKQKIGYSLGLSYRFWYYYGIGNIWRHSFESIVNPSGNSIDEVFIEEAIGTQQSKTLTYYIYRDTRDNYLNPTRGWRAEFSIAFTGGYILRGDDHFVTYSPDVYFYYTPFHLPFLKTHPCVFELRGNASFIRPPFQRGKVENMQSNEDNPWLDLEDRMYIGGAETLRGWEHSSWDDEFPVSWGEGLFHRILYGMEFRVPVHPQMLWLAFFFDAGSLWSDDYWERNLSEDRREIFESDKATDELLGIDEFFKKDKMSYFKYSWGFGFKIQIPMMPLRFWFGRRLQWVGKDEGYFKEISNFNFQFAIGDMRF